jgi:hypothetical protein
VLAAAAWGKAAELPLPATEPPVFLVLFDLRSLEPGEVTNTTDGGGPISFPLSAIDDTAVVCSDLKSQVPVKQLKGYVECAIGHRLSGPDFNEGEKDDAKRIPTVAERIQAARAIAASLLELRKKGSTRAISDRGSNIVAVGLQAAEMRTITQTVTTRCADPVSEDKTDITHEIVFGRKPKFVIAEVTRKSQIETDFNALVSLALKFARKAPPPPPVRPPAVCRKPGGTETTYASKSSAVPWSSGHPIPLTVKRATVTVDATLPAVAPQLLAATDAKTAAVIVKAADDYLRIKALQDQEKEDLKLLTACPAIEPNRLDPLPQVVCALDTNTTSTSLSAVEALSKMTTPRRSTFLRWAVEKKTGEVREKALLALAQITAPAAPAATPGKEVKQTTKFLSGPLEHWSLSGDLFTTRETLFKKDDSGTVVLDGKPPIFYVSLNFLFGDRPSTERTFAENIELKWLVQGSKSPFDSVGFGIGLRGSHAKRFGFDFELLSPFVGWTWTAPEDSTQDRVRETRFGISLNINKALEWVK